LKKPALTKVQKNPLRENPSGNWTRGDMTQEKPGVIRIACAVGHYNRENPAWLFTYAAAAILRYD